MSTQQSRRSPRPHRHMKLPRTLQPNLHNRPKPRKHRTNRTNRTIPKPTPETTNTTLEPLEPSGPIRRNLRNNCTRISATSETPRRKPHGTFIWTETPKRLFGEKQPTNKPCFDTSKFRTVSAEQSLYQLVYMYIPYIFLYIIYTYIYILYIYIYMYTFVYQGFA